MRTDETNPADWYMLARERLEKADALFEQFGASYSGVELLQEALERYLKGYLISQGWTLQRIHNLAALLDSAIVINAEFKRFAQLCEALTAQYWQQHYPGGDLTDVGADYDSMRSQAGELVALILGSCPGDQAAQDQEEPH